MYTAHVNQPDPRFGNMLLEQFGGANGELAAAMQYSIQGINCEDMVCKDLHWNRGAKPFGNHRHFGANAPQADEEKR
jgi:Mn-containing catalase